MHQVRLDDVPDMQYPYFNEAVPQEEPEAVEYADPEIYPDGRTDGPGLHAILEQ
jgi:hypothetical protein